MCARVVQTSQTTLNDTVCPGVQRDTSPLCTLHTSDQPNSELNSRRASHLTAGPTPAGPTPPTANWSTMFNWARTPLPPIELRACLAACYAGDVRLESQRCTHTHGDHTHLAACLCGIRRVRCFSMIRTVHIILRLGIPSGFLCIALRSFYLVLFLS